MSKRNKDAPEAEPEFTGASAAAPGEPGGTEPTPEEGADPLADRDPEEQLRAERDELKDRLLRSVADLDNLRKRSRREVEQARERGIADLAAHLLDVLDNLDRALASTGEGPHHESLIQGVEMVRHMFLTRLAEFSIVPIETVGRPFDPHYHEALSQVETLEIEPGQVVQELSRGYRLGDRLLRAACVSVSRRPTPPEEEGQARGGETADKESN